MKTIYLKYNKRGITLISLVITIVIMLILAGVTINLTIGNNGLFTKSKTSSKNYKKSQALEELNLKAYEVQTSKESNATLQDLIDLLNLDTQNSYKISTDSNVDIESPINLDGKDSIYVIYKSFKFKIDNNLLVTFFADSTENNNPPSETPTEKSDKIISYKFKGAANEEADVVHLNDNTINQNDASTNSLTYNSSLNGLVFNGSSSYAIINNKTSYIFPITIELLVSMNSIRNEVIYDDPSHKIAVGIWDDYFCLSLSTATTTYKLPADLADGNLKHLVITYKTGISTVEMYINGTKLTETCADDAWFGTTGSTSYLGTNYQDKFFKGTLYIARVYNKQLSQDEITSSYNSDINFINNNSNQIDRTNLILEYTVKNHTKNLSKIIDQTKNNNSASLNKVFYTRNKDGIIFNGSSSYAQIDTQSQYDFPISIELILSAPSIKNEVFYDDPAHNICIGIWTNYFCFSLNNETVTYKVPSDFANSTPKHIVCLYNKDSTTVEMYLNGTKLAETCDNDAWFERKGSTSYLGHNVSGNYFNGTLYEFNVYNRLLSNQDILNNYNNLNY